jgi:hypothetical protein
MWKDSLEFDGLDTMKKTILGNKRKRFLGSLLDATGQLRKTRHVRLLAF